MTAQEKSELSLIPVGSNFEYAGHEWIVLEQSPHTTLCIASGIVSHRSFDDFTANFAESNICKYLNNEFFDDLTLHGADADDFAPLILDLTADDGLNDYGTTTVKVGLITCDLYRKYRYLIPNANDWWWTATAWTPYISVASCARNVNTYGSLYSSYVTSSYGVRPLINLISDISISKI